MSRTAAAAFAACMMFGMAFAAPASAAQNQTTTQRVAYGDLNLDSPSGAQAMLQRIHRAARVACEDRTGVMTLAERRQVRICRMEAEQRAVSDLNHATVTAMFYNRQPRVTVAAN